MFSSPLAPDASLGVSHVRSLWLASFISAICCPLLMLCSLSCNFRANGNTEHPGPSDQHVTLNLSLPFSVPQLAFGLFDPADLSCTCTCTTFDCTFLSAFRFQLTTSIGLIFHQHFDGFHYCLDTILNLQEPVSLDITCHPFLLRNHLSAAGMESSNMCEFLCCSYSFSYVIGWNSQNVLSLLSINYAPTEVV